MLFLSFLVISTCCITGAGSMRVDSENRMSSSRFYSENSRRFSIVDTEDNVFWNDFFQMTGQHNYIIYSLIWDEDIDIRAVYIDGKTDTPNILSGRFFEESDVVEKSSTAVIGKSHEQDVEIKNGASYYIYNDVEYEVIGIMGTERDSRVNEMIFLDFYSGLELNSTNGSYVLDANNSKIVDSVVSDLESAMVGKTGSIYISAEELVTGIDRIFSDQSMTQTLYGLILLCFLLSTMVVAVLWVSYRKNTIAVKMMLGHENWQISLDLIKNYFKAALIAYIVSLLCVIFIQQVNALIQPQWQDLLLAILITIIFGGVSFIYPLIKTLRLNVTDAMR